MDAMVFLDKTRMLSEFWKRRLNPYEGPGAGGEGTGDVEEVTPGRSVFRDVLVWTSWGFAVMVAIALVVVLAGSIF